MPSEDELKTAAQLAQEGYLSSVKKMNIVNRNISEISSDNMAKLASIVTDFVNIDNMTPSTQLGTILASVQSEDLYLGTMSLNKKNTQALVTAMRTRVQYVKLYGNVTLNPKILSTYDGQGRCTGLDVRVSRYWSRLSRWARDKGWRVNAVNDGAWLIFYRGD